MEITLISLKVKLGDDEIYTLYQNTRDTIVIEQDTESGRESICLPRRLCELMPKLLAELDRKPLKEIA